MLKTLIRGSAAAAGTILVFGAVTWYATLPEEDPRGIWTVLSQIPLKDEKATQAG
ncbi:hypothetical protein [Ruegeria atlantica]|uniref:hypothetical protein n=1 Tax=Ruegeria atlantica TaxID=81569 RepID=UPI00147D2A65|nr:hypothetical protein [Ruegeria atlantica]